MKKIGRPGRAGCRRSVKPEADPGPGPPAELPGGGNVFFLRGRERKNRLVKPSFSGGNKNNPMRIGHENNFTGKGFQAFFDIFDGRLDHRQTDNRLSLFAKYRIAEVDSPFLRCGSQGQICSGPAGENFFVIWPEGKIFADKTVRIVPVARRNRRAGPVHQVADAHIQRTGEVVENFICPPDVFQIARCPEPAAQCPHAGQRPYWFNIFRQVGREVFFNHLQAGGHPKLGFGQGICPHRRIKEQPAHRG